MHHFARAIMALPLLAASAFAQEAEIIFTGAEVVTMNSDQPLAEAVAVAEGRILAVGTEQAVASAH